MNMRVDPTAVALNRSLSDVVAEYDQKAAGLTAAVAAFDQAGTTLKMAATIAGVYGDTTIDTGHVYERDLQINLLKSAWKHIYGGLQIDRIASADDKRKWQMALENPAPFTIDNIRGTFGHYIKDPRGNILRALAEVFCSLDQAYKSHDKVKVGVAGLPKRIIISSVGYWSSYGMNKLRDMFNALAAYQGKPMIEHKEFDELDKLHNSFKGRSGVVVIRGLTIKKFINGNAHVMFDKNTLRDINKALAEFYGAVLPDTTDEKPVKKQASTAVAKDLQYYPTPAKVVEDIIIHKWGAKALKGKRLLDPNCGCGRILESGKKHGAIVFGIEVDAGRVAIARAKGFAVLHANFLETAAEPKYDIVLMNPPFYGKHYAKHVRHALKFVAPGGVLVAILPVTARYDHGELDDVIPQTARWASSPWHDLPVGSFSESGTNINTTVLTIRKGG